MHRSFQILSFLFYLYCVHCTQPYFPSQVVFTMNNGQTLFAIDEVNQRAFMSSGSSSSPTTTAYVYQHFPDAPVDEPQSKYYVQLATGFYNDSCLYGTYWRYGGNEFNYFPTHWDNFTSFQIKNFLKIDYKMIHSTNASDVEDYWYADETCVPDVGVPNPCFQIYFKKNTDVPLRSIQLVVHGFRQVFDTIEYQVLSVGQPDDKYFSGIPKNWFTQCTDVMLKVAYDYDTPIIKLHETKIIGVSLFTPPHKINGNDTMTIRWNVTDGCTDCLTWTPTEMSFNGQNFYETQNLTFYRRKMSSSISLSPIFHGGAFDDVSPETNGLNFQ